MDKHLTVDDSRELHEVLKSGKLVDSKINFFSHLSTTRVTPSDCGYLIGLEVGQIPKDALDYYEQLTGQKF